ncbi:MAG: alpha/beta hydrolase, partial [Alphaproteobacteria bacterium]
DMAALDLKKQDFSKLAARLILVHGRDDAIIPYSESEALAAVAPRADLYVVDSLAHVDLGLGGLVDTIVLWRAVYRLLAERDAAPPPAL